MGTSLGLGQGMEYQFFDAPQSTQAIPMLRQARLQQLREQTEKARAEALAAQHEADRQREEYRQKAAQLEREAEEAAELGDWRGKLQANDRVQVSRFGQAGRVIRADAKKRVALVSVGLGQWEVPFDELFPLDKA